MVRFVRGLWLTVCLLPVVRQLPAVAQESPTASTRSARQGLGEQDAERHSARIERDRERLEELQTDFAKRQDEYHAALKELSTLQGDVAARRKQHSATIKKGDDTAIKSSEADLEGLETRLRLAQERVDLAIVERKAVRALIDQLERKMEDDIAAYQKRTVRSAPATSAVKPAEKVASAQGLELVTGASSATEESSVTAPAKEVASPRVAEAEAKASQKMAEATQARQDAEALDRRKANLEASIALERKRLANTYQRHDNLSQTMIKLEEEIFRKLEEGKQIADLGDLSQRRDRTREELATLSDEIKQQSTRVEDLQSRLLGLQQEQLLAKQEVKERQAEAEVATRARWVVTVTDYALVTLPRVALILLVLFAIYYASRLLGRRLIAFLARTERGTADERQYRTQTLTSVFENAVTTGLYVVGGLMVLDTLKVPVSTLLGGVAVVGLAVAFGAQNLIRDYFYGFMILLEDQFKISDTVTINNMTGQVERITLRITVLRDFEGKVYFIPNGQINSVINQTHEWSRVVLDIPISYSEKPERAMGVLLELAEALARDPAFKNSIVREPELFGVEKLADSAVLVRVCLVTRPSQKDAIRRELLRRIKARFDELHIEIPFPQRTIHFDRLGAQGKTLPPDNETNGVMNADTSGQLP